MRAVLGRTLGVLLLLLGAGAVEAQNAADDAGWNSERALALIERARARRLLPRQDTTLRNYTARAEGFVYFYLDRRDGSERTLVKVDQVALELSWAPPNRTQQRIVGLRDVSRLPNRMHYHLDHLTVVQNGFGDVIRMGDGDEVRDVPHPAAPGSESVYEFRLADSLTLRLPSMASSIRVYELEVRPLDPDRPALVGSVFVDRGSADIVRMTFTFTPASYVDRRLDYISVALDNGLWEGRYWLPNEQTLQIRRQIPELDFAAGAVIQGRMRIADYTFNDSLAPAFVPGNVVTAVPESEREAYEFERGIYDDLNDAGLAPPPDLSEIRRQAAELLGTRRLSGLPRLRLGIGAASSALRYNRAEGVALGAGLSYAPDPVWRLDVEGGFAFGPERPWASVELGGTVARSTNASLRVAFRDVRDVGVAPGLPGAVNTLSALLLGRDYTDPFFATGARLLFNRRLGDRASVGLELIGERHTSATLTQSTPPLDESGAFRSVRPIDEGDLSAAVLSLHRPMPDPRADDWSAAVDVEIGTTARGYYLRPTARASLHRATTDHSRALAVRADAGLVTSDAPSQRLFVLGGLGTLPGYPFRSFAGRRFVLLRLEASAALIDPWLRLRIVGASGATGGLPNLTTPSDTDPPAWQSWPATGSAGLRSSAGAGVSLFWDLLRLDAVRGLDGGHWRFIISFHPELADVS